MQGAIPVLWKKDTVIPVISNQRMNSYLDEIASKADIKEASDNPYRAPYVRYNVAQQSMCLSKQCRRCWGIKTLPRLQIYATMLDQTVSEDMGRMRDKFDSLKVDIKPLPEKPTTFERPPCLSADDPKNRNVT